MSETHVISALRAKRAEVSGYIRDLENKVKRYRANLVHIDATIRVFAPNLNPDSIAPKRRYQRSRYIAKGEISRAVLDALRRANGQPIKTATVVDSLMAAKGFQPDDIALAESIAQRVLTVLRRLSKQGAVILGTAAPSVRCNTLIHRL
jgi:hypothetical protein